MASSLSAASKASCFFETRCYLTQSGKSEARDCEFFPAQIKVLRAPLIKASGFLSSVESQPFIRLQPRNDTWSRSTARRVMTVVAQDGSAPAKTATPAESDRWWTSDTIAVVTGGNKSSIGLEVVRKLSKEGVKVIFTSRSGKFLTTCNRIKHCEIRSKHCIFEKLRTMNLFVLNSGV